MSCFIYIYILFTSFSNYYTKIFVFCIDEIHYTTLVYFLIVLWHLCVCFISFYFILFSLSKLFNVFVIHLPHCLAPGRGMVSFHAHHGPVKFLTMATAVCNVSQATMATLTSNTPSQCQPGAPEVEGTQLDENCSEVRCSSTSSPSHAPVLQDSLSSSCGSLALSQGSLEHGPEEGAIYDLLNEPTHFQKTKQTEKVNVSSLLVVSGGLGHRRINRKTKQSKQEEMVSTIMVWQIPLPSLWEKKMEVFRTRWGSGFSLDAAAQTPVSIILLFLLLI